MMAGCVLPTGDGVNQRLKVIGPGLAVGATVALMTAGPVMPSGTGVGERAFAWAAVMGGPILGTAWGMTAYHPPVSLGWLGLLLIPAHPLRPHWATGILTAFGLAVWFFAGFAAVMVAVWGG